MSTFDGRIKEYPELAIDNFTPNSFSQFFLLSHVHSDHTRGLEREDFTKPLYCSEQTARMLPLMETRAERQLMYAHLKDRLRPIEYYEPTSVKVNNRVIKFTFYPANHCPGASLILIEGDKGTVLYTGDMRAEPDFVQNNLGCFRNFRIKNLYMDTTCCHEDKRHFISKSDSVDLLVDLVKKYPKDYHMYLDTWTAGYEEMWITIKEHFNCKVHVSQKRYNMYVSLEEMYSEVLTTDPTSTRFHSCRWDEGCFKHSAHTVGIHPKPTRSIKPYDYKASKYSTLLCSDLPRHCTLYQQMILPFSTHSSLSEIVFFYKFVKPYNFTPCVVRGGRKGEYEMHELLLQEGCHVSRTPSSSEIERGNETSSCSIDDIRSEPRSVTDDESTTCNTINFMSTVEDPSAKSSASAKSMPSVNNNNSNNIPSQPLSEKSVNIPKTPNSDDVLITKSPSLSKEKTMKPKSFIRSKHVSLSQEVSSSENENMKPPQHISASLPIISSTHKSSLTLKGNASLSHSSLSFSSKTKTRVTLQGLKRTQSRESVEDQSAKITDSLDPNVIVLSIPSTLDASMTVSTSYSETQSKQAQIDSDSDDNSVNNGLSITCESSQNFVNAFVAMRKRRRRNNGSSKINPIIL